MAVPLTPVTTNLPQSRSVPSCEALRDGGHPGAQVPSYVDAPIGVLKMMVPGLSGIRIDMVENASDGTPAMPTQDMTASILNRTGAVIADQFHRMPNLIAKEEVKEPKYTTLEYGCQSPPCDQVGGPSGREHRLQNSEPVFTRTASYTNKRRPAATHSMSSGRMRMTSRLTTPLTIPRDCPMLASRQRGSSFYLAIFRSPTFATSECRRSAIAKPMCWPLLRFQSRKVCALSLNPATALARPRFKGWPG